MSTPLRLTPAQRQQLETCRDWDHCLPEFVDAILAALAEIDALKAECASISAEFGLPPSIRPAEGECARILADLRRARDEAREQLRVAREAMGVLRDVQDERVRQDAQWGGPDHDDEHSTFDFLNYMRHQIRWIAASPSGSVEERARLVKTAALAVAAVQSFDRKALAPKPLNDPPTHQCKICGALWWCGVVDNGVAKFPSWSLRSEKCGHCCDNVAMGDQVAPLRALAPKPEHRCWRGLENPAISERRCPACRAEDAASDGGTP